MKQLGQVQQILTKEMSRKEFLQHIGVFTAGAVGITAVANHFFKLSGYQPGKQAGMAQAKGYGTRLYGR